MFGHLIESTSHTGEFTRRGYFIVLTAVCYGVLIMVGAVASVYAYDANLETQDLEVVSLINPNLPQVQPPKQVQPHHAEQRPNQVAERTALVSRIAESTKVPDKISTEASKVPEMPPGPVRISNRNLDVIGPAGPAGPIGPSGNSTEPSRIVVVEDTTTPPEPVKPKPVIISKGPVTGQAISLPKPAYPQAAKIMHLGGSVKVQVLIDETGKVVSAQVLEGHPILSAPAAQAARQARFSPTILGGNPVKVSGYIVYNFTQQ
jgi:protein TonB